MGWLEECMLRSRSGMDSTAKTLRGARGADSRVAAICPVRDSAIGEHLPSTPPVEVRA